MLKEVSSILLRPVIFIMLLLHGASHTLDHSWEKCIFETHRMKHSHTLFTHVCLKNPQSSVMQKGGYAKS